jgi:uncharacterized protein (DUF1501 family)
MLTRRSFLQAAGITIGMLGSTPAWLLRAAAQTADRRKILVVVFQRGAADGLNMVVPFFETRYYALRPSIAVPAPGAAGGAIDLDGRFALHPALQPLKPLWDSRTLAIVHAAGSPDPSRSHFDAQDYMECGTPGTKTADGWLNRSMPQAVSVPSALRAVAMASEIPLSLRGGASAIAVADLETFQAGAVDTADLLERLYVSSGDANLGAQGKATFEAVRAIDAIRRQPYAPANGAQYIGVFGRRLRQIAQLIKADVGLEVACADIGGWDHHSDETQQLTPLLREFGGSLLAFARDLDDRLGDVVLVTMSEFGRTTAENGNGGTDHGRGNVMLVVGGPVRGGTVYGRWPGLGPEQLVDRRDLAVTTDFRDVLGELVTGHRRQDVTRVFPNYAAPGPLGLLQV